MRRYGLVDIPTEASDINAVPASSDSVISGGIVTWSGSGLIFNVSDCNYYIDNNYYTSPFTTITLATADPTNDRIDVFAVDTNGDAIVITGTPSANPQEPQTDPATQLKLTTIIVTAGSTSPSGISNNMIYDENVESWSKSNSSLTVDYVNTTTPYVGTYCILATTTSASTFKALTFYKSSTYSNKADYDIFSFAIKLSQTLLTSESIKIIFLNSSLYPNTKVAEYSITSNNTLGFSINNTSAYQLLGIPMSNINFNNNSFNYVQIQFVTSRSSISFRLDRILMQYGVTQPSTPTSSNSFGFVNANSGSASATVATDTLNVVGSGLVTTSATAKTLTISATNPVSGTLNYVSKFTGSGATIGNSLIYDNGTNVAIGTTSPSSDTKLQIEGKVQSNVSTTTSSSSIYSVVGNTTVSYPSGASATGIAVNAVQGGTSYTFAGNATIANSTITSSIIAVSSIGFTSSGTVTQNQASGVRSISNIFAMWLKNADVAGTITHMSNLRLVAFYSAYTSTNLTVSNYYGIIIEDSSQFSGISITNKWGIYQEGANDYNYFNGKLLIGTTTAGTEILKVVGSAIISSTTTLSSLAGSGTRMVVADGSGVLSTQAIPSGGSGTVTNVSALTIGTSGTDLSSTVANSTTTPVITLNVPTASSTNRGALSSTDWTTFNNKQSSITLTTTGTSGAATFISNTLNIPQYSAGSNIYNSDGTLTAARTLTNGGFSLSFVGSTYTNRFTSTGRLLVGTTTESTYLLDVAGNGRFTSQINGRAALTNTETGSDFAILLNGINTTDTTTRYLINLSTLSSTGVGFGAIGITATLTNNSSGTFFTSNVAGGYGHIVNASSGTAAVPAFAVRQNGQTSGGAIGYTFMQGNTQAFKLNLHNDGTNQNLRILSDGGGAIMYVRDRAVTNTTFGAYAHYDSAQVAIDSTTRGFLPPRLTTTQKNAITSPATGLLVYDTTLNRLSGYNGTTWDNNISSGYSIQFSTFSIANFTLLDATDYYIGNGQSLNNADVSRHKIYISKAGTIKSAYVIGSFSTNGTAENWTMEILKNGTTATTIAVNATTANSRVWSNTSLSISVAAGDTIEIRSVGVTWATNPACNAGYGFSATVYIE